MEEGPLESERAEW